MRHFIFLYSICFLAFTSFGQGFTPIGASSMSMGNASVCRSDVWGFFQNPGALAEVDDIEIGVSYENRFLLKELQSQGVAAVVPLKTGVLSVGAQMFGYSQYRSLKGGVGYSMQLAEKLFAGVQLNYQGLFLSQNYGSANTVTAEAGIVAKFTDQWKLGASVFNLGRSKLSEFQDDRFSTVVRIGTSYDFSKKVLLALEVEKRLEYTARFKLGIEYEPVQNFFLRGGVNTSPLEVSFGAGYNFPMIRISVGSAYHQLLGWSPHFSLVYSIKRNK